MTQTATPAPTPSRPVGITLPQYRQAVIANSDCPHCMAPKGEPCLRTPSLNEAVGYVHDNRSVQYHNMICQVITQLSRTISGRW